MAFDLSKAAYGKASVSNLDKIKMIPLDKIKTNEKNFYKITKLEELMDSIRMVGLLDPVRVVPMEGGEYRLISGHRRYEAFLELDADSPTGGGIYSRIPALVLEDMDDLTESFALITANSTARELTYSEKLEQESQLRATLLAMKEEGREVPRNLGQYIADQIGVSRNEVSRMHSVNENLIPEARAKLDAGEMTAQQAYEMSRRPKEEQKKSYYVEESIAHYQQEATEQRKLLDRFIEIWAGEYAYRATSGVTDRFESIQLLNQSCRNRGGNSGGVDYTSSAKGVVIPRAGDRPYSWSAIWDALAMYALRDLGKRYKEGKHKEDTSAWSRGLPPEPGCYAVRVKITPSSEIRTKILYRKYDTWQMFPDTTDCPINPEARILGWIRLPEDGKED